MFSVTLTEPTWATRPTVVAAEVEQLDVLGTLLLVSQQFHGQRCILFVRGAAAASAGDRANGDHARSFVGYVLVLEAHQDFRRGADDVEIVAVEIEHVGRRIERAQRAVKGHAGWP
jgi:hypothetical protein